MKPRGRKEARKTQDTPWGLRIRASIGLGLIGFRAFRVQGLGFRVQGFGVWG